MRALSVVAAVALSTLLAACGASGGDTGSGAGSGGAGGGGPGSGGSAPGTGGAGGAGGSTGLGTGGTSPSTGGTAMGGTSSSTGGAATGGAATGAGGATGSGGASAGGSSAGGGAGATGTGGACTNAADQNVLNTQDVQTAATDCAGQCLGAGDCSKTCLIGKTGLSDACGSCFGTLIGCSTQKCALQCIDSASQACTDCVNAGCQPAFDACSGITR
jgi:hypothetical protein